MNSTKLLNAITGSADRPPKGWKSAKEWGDEWQLSQSRCWQLLDKGLKEGILDCIKVRVLTRAGCPRRTLYYGPKTQKA